MALNISTNTAAHRASANLSLNQARLQRSFDRISSGKKVSSPVEDPGNLSVSMKLEAAINRLTGAQNNVKNAISFLEVQDGFLATAGRIVDRMSELKGLSSQDPMKSAQDRASYNNEFKDLQVQLYNISQQGFNGVSLFANFATEDDGSTGTTEILFGAENTSRSMDNTLTIFTSTEGSAGSKVSVYKSSLLSALTLKTDKTLAKDVGTNAEWSTVVANQKSNDMITFAADEVANTIDLDDISVGVITQALENVSYLRAQSGGSQSRLAFNLESLTQQKTNMRAALGRIVDVDIAEESTNVAKYSILNQAAASMLAQANASSDVALMLLR